MSNEKNIVHQEKLDDIEESFISYLAHVERKFCTIERIAPAIRGTTEEKMSMIKATVYLNKLKDLGLVDHNLNMIPGIKPEWYLTERGMKYAVLHGLDELDD
jgi:hypothetical protein